MSELVRANRISVVMEDGVLVATFYRTHRKLGKVDQFDSMYQMVDGVNSVAQKELFRQDIIQHANDFGYDYDPEDRRADKNKLPSKYENDWVLETTSKDMVRDNVTEWVSKMNDGGMDIDLVTISCEGISPVSLSKNGKEVKPKYNNGNWAWATITVSAVVKSHNEELYVDMDLSLVSGQLKKPTKIGELGYNYTGFSAEVGRQLEELGIQVQEADKSHTEGAKDTPVEEVAVDTEEQTIQYPDWVRINKDGTPNKRDLKKWESQQQ